MRLRNYFVLSKFILIISACLITLGLTFIYSSSCVIAYSEYNDAAFFLKRQFVFLLIGIIVIYKTINLKMEYYKQYADYLYFSSIALLILVLIPGIGKSAGGSFRWISLGLFKVQAGEIFKCASIVYLSMSLAEKKDKILSLKIEIISHLILPTTGMILLLFEPDFGTAFIILSVTFIMLFISGVRIIYLLSGSLFALPILINVIASSPYRMARVISFIDPWGHRQEGGYQVVQSLITFGSGGLWGKGIGRGFSKLYFLPAAHTDFILSIIGEELGFIGICLTIFCFAIIISSGFYIAIKCKETFEVYLAFGLTSLLAIQAVLNIFVALGLLPTKGLTLPLVSYGGSSLISTCWIIGVLVHLGNKINVKTRTDIKTDIKIMMS